MLTSRGALLAGVDWVQPVLEAMPDWANAEDGHHSLLPLLHHLTPTTPLLTSTVLCLQVWIGYNQSLRPCQTGLTLNMDITAAAFLEGQPMLQLISTTVGMQDLTRGLNPVQVKSINKAVRGVQV